MFFLRKYKPQTPGTRHRVNNIQFENLKKQKHFFFYKSRYSCAGRNQTGQITVRHKSAVLKRKPLLWVDRIRSEIILISIVLGIYKQKPNMCFFGLIRYSSGIYSYIPLAHDVKISQFLADSHFLSLNFELPLGVLCFFLENHVTYKFFNICSYFYKKSIYAKAAGTFCLFILKNIERNILKIVLPSEQVKFLTIDYFATVGRASNIYAFKFCHGKAGLNRKLGKRPTVRGVAMNAVDHPNGGRTKAKQPERTP